ncbi:copper amine oxidase N-terminal domain-containing protein [Paenibacillaceae bacterium]|nr:copper amine oxidase N-terminal domain-containing protein [Paenibacillaceae bacterium]
MKSRKSKLSLKWLLIASMITVPLISSPEVSKAQGNPETLVLRKNSDTMVHNGQSVKAVQPVTFKDGSSYAPFRNVAERYGYKVSYNAKTKESIASNGELEIRFTANSSNINVNGQIVKSSGTVYIQQGFLMIPLRTWANLTNSTLSLLSSEMTFKWNSKPEETAAPQANFEVLPDKEDIYAGETRVTYVDKAILDSGRTIVDERWEGRQDIFDTAGTHTITRYIMDDTGTWSEPYTVTIQVRMPNQPPVADFTTDKTTYRMGETITYIDRSTDDEDSIDSRKWTGREMAFFEAGSHTVTLEVTDQHGLSDKISKDIMITNEVLYNQEEYYRLNAPVGSKYPTVGSSILNNEPVSYKVVSEPARLIRINSPETLRGEGITYDEMLSGETRFMFHNQNSTDRNLKMYVVATNLNNTTAKVGFNAFGLGGPNTYVSTGGKLAVARYLQSLKSGEETHWLNLKPGETQVVLPELSKVPLKPGQVFSAYADLVSDTDVRFQVIIVEDGKDPVAELPNLQMLPPDNIHVRGTFNGANRSLIINETLGYKGQRIVLGDRTIDRYLDGYDNTTGSLQLNTGNFGVLYKMTVQIAPRTVVTLNPRGGHYAGAFLINGKLVNTTDNSILRNSNESGVLHRTGNSVETVEFIFTPASGSNLPLQMLFLPMPEIRN